MKTTNLKTANLINGDFIVGAWEGPRKFVFGGSRDEVRARLEEMRELGTNMLFLFAELADAEWLTWTLDAARETGIKLIPDLSAVWRDKEKREEYVRKTRDSEMVIAYNVVDEPPHTWAQELAEAVAHVKELAPNKPVFTNLNPTYAPPSYFPPTSGNDPYGAYLDLILHVVKPDVISFDYYPYIGGEDREKDMKTGMLRNLAKLASRSVSSGLPLAGFLQSSRWGRKDPETGEWHGTRIPTANEYRFLANVHLAFGCKMLTNFLYWSRTGTRPEQRMPGIFDGIISEDGSPTYVANYVKSTWDAISANAALLSKLDFIGVIPVNFDEQEVEAVSDAALAIDSGNLEDVGDWNASGKCLVGVFEDTCERRKVFYAVNMCDSMCDDTIVASVRYKGSPLETRLLPGEGKIVKL